MAKFPDMNLGGVGGLYLYTLVWQRGVTFAMKKCENTWTVLLSSKKLCDENLSHLSMCGIYSFFGWRGIVDARFSCMNLFGELGLRDCILKWQERYIHMLLSLL